MGVLIAVEGLDGAGKATLVAGLTNRWHDVGLRTATITFPRYGASAHADLAAEALRGQHGDLSSSAYAMALLFAFDRATAADEIRAALDTHDVVLLDRYVASNAAYTAARCGEGVDGPAVAWVGELEFGRFDLPVPDQQILLGVEPDRARDRAAARADADETRALDAYERDSELQARTFVVYAQLAAAQWRSPWTVLPDSSDWDGLRPVEDLVRSARG